MWQGAVLCHIKTANAVAGVTTLYSYDEEGAGSDMSEFKNVRRGIIWKYSMHPKGFFMTARD